jgi:hypothetical protein
MKNPKVKYTDKYLFSFCKTIKDIKTLRLEHSNIYNLCRKRGILLDATAHMRQPTARMGEEEVLNEAKKYKTKKEFSKRAPWAYAKARRLGVFEKCCSHMLSRAEASKRGQTVWSIDKVLKTAKKHSRKIDFRKKDNAAYQAARRNGWLEEATQHMEHRVEPLSKEICRKVAKKYKLKSTFRSKERSVYSRMCKKGWLKELTSHMK